MVHGNGVYVFKKKTTKMTVWQELRENCLYLTTKWNWLEWGCYTYNDTAAPVSIRLKRAMVKGAYPPPSFS